MQDSHSPCPVNCYRFVRSGKRLPYKSPVTRRRDYCDPSTCNANVGTDFKPEFNSRSYNVRHLVNKIQELKGNVQDLDETQRHDKWEKTEQQRTFEQSSDIRITDLKGARDAVETCLREMGKVKSFLEDENSWWKILKERSVNCCQQKSPHLHGVLDGSSVTLMLLEDATNEIPHRFVTSTPKKNSGTADFKFPDSSRELTNETKHIEQCTNRWDKYTEEYAKNSYTVPCYDLGTKSTLIETTSTDRREPTQRYARNKQTPVASGFWAEEQEDRSHQQKISYRSDKPKETRDKTNLERKDNRDERTNTPSKDLWCSRLRSRKASSNENIGKMVDRTADFESNVDLNTNLPFRNTSHKVKVSTMKTVKKATDENF